MPAQRRGEKRHKGRIERQPHRADSQEGGVLPAAGEPAGKHPTGAKIEIERVGRGKESAAETR